MIRIRLLPLVPTVVLVLGSLLAPLPAHASSCWSGPQFDGVTTGQLTSTDWATFWDTESTGTTTVALISTALTMQMNVYTEDCSQVCVEVHSCMVTYTGTLSLLVWGEEGAYILSAASSGDPDGGPLPTPPPGACNVVDTAGVCANVEADTLQTRADVFGVWTGLEFGSHRVYGAIDIYRFPLPTGGSVLLPCVVFAVNSVANYGCEAAGGTFESRFATLIERTVARRTAGLGDPIASVGVCDALVTFTVSGFGAENVPAYSLC